MNLTKKRPEFWAKTFLFWSARMVVARWNLVRIECGPLVQKVADPCSKAPSSPWPRTFIVLLYAMVLEKITREIICQLIRSAATRTLF